MAILYFLMVPRSEFERIQILQVFSRRFRKFYRILNRNFLIEIQYFWIQYFWIIFGPVFFFQKFCQIFQNIFLKISFLTNSVPSYQSYIQYFFTREERYAAKTSRGRVKNIHFFVTDFFYGPNFGLEVIIFYEFFRIF